VAGPSKSGQTAVREVSVIPLGATFEDEMSEYGKSTPKRQAARRARRKRAPLQTQEALLQAAVVEFAREGYGGARVERISRAAKSNDRMLYYYFGSKERLFQRVVEYCYADIVARGEALPVNLEHPREALAELVAFNWNYYWEKPELLSILASENLFKGCHIKGNISEAFANRQLGLLNRILTSGAKSREFKPDCDPLMVFLSILSLTYFYRANLYTLSNYVRVDFAKPELREKWLKHIQGMIDDLVAPTCAPRL
jgi:AcrR family transcriptional regulator